MPYPTDQLNETVTVQPRAGGVTAYGEPVPGTEYEAICYLEPGNKMVFDSKGQEIVSALFGIFGADCAIAVADEIVWNEKTYRAIAVDQLRFGGVAHHMEAYFASVTP